MFVFFDFPDNVVPPEPTARGTVDNYLQRQYNVYDSMMVTMNPDMKEHQFGVRNANEYPEQIKSFGHTRISYFCYIRQYWSCIDFHCHG